MKTERDIITIILALIFMLLFGVMCTDSSLAREGYIPRYSPNDLTLRRELEGEVLRARGRNPGTLSHRVLDYAIIIAKVESGIQQVNSVSGKDIGIFQFHTDTITAYKLDKVKLQSDLEYQVDSFILIMMEKYSLCVEKYPNSWPACWHSSTEVLHYNYWQKLEKARKLLYREARNETKSDCY